MVGEPGHNRRVRIGQSPARLGHPPLSVGAPHYRVRGHLEAAEATEEMPRRIPRPSLFGCLNPDQPTDPRPPVIDGVCAPRAPVIFGGPTLSLLCAVGCDCSRAAFLSSDIYFDRETLQAALEAIEATPEHNPVTISPHPGADAENEHINGRVALSGREPVESRRRSTYVLFLFYKRLRRDDAWGSPGGRLAKLTGQALSPGP
jgi:hypothetical protein